MSEKAQGFEEYTPSRLEWLVTVLNSIIHYINDDQIEFIFRFGNDGNTIVMRMTHPADLSPEKVKENADIGKDFAMDLAKNYRWDSWLKIQVEFDPTDN